MEEKENKNSKNSNKDKAMDNEEQIELRSSNARQFIKEEPPFLIRYGTVIIVFILILVAAFLYLTVKM